MITFDDITACLVTRGNVDMQPILDTLPYGEIIIWDNSQELVDLKVYGRYAAAVKAKNSVVYFQDDDVIFTEHDELLMRFQQFYITHDMVTNNAHGPNVAGYNNVPLVAAGAICHKWAVLDTLHYYIERNSVIDANLLYYCDFAIGPLLKYVELDLPYTRLYADEDYHLCRQPWAEALKKETWLRACQLLNR